MREAGKRQRPAWPHGRLVPLGDEMIPEWHHFLPTISSQLCLPRPQPPCPLDLLFSRRSRSWPGTDRPNGFGAVRWEQTTYDVADLGPRWYKMSRKEIPMIELNEQQMQALENLEDTPPQVMNPRTK